MFRYNASDFKVPDIAQEASRQLRNVIFEDIPIENIYIYGVHIEKDMDVGLGRYLPKRIESALFLRRKGYKVYEYTPGRSSLTIGLGYNLRDTKSREAIRIVKFLAYVANNKVGFPADLVGLNTDIRWVNFAHRQDVMVAESLEETSPGRGT